MLPDLGYLSDEKPRKHISHKHFHYFMRGTHYRISLRNLCNHQQNDNFLHKCTGANALWWTDQDLGFSTISRPAATFTFSQTVCCKIVLEIHTCTIPATPQQFIKNATKLSLLLQTNSHITQYFPFTDKAFAWLSFQYQVQFHLTPVKCVLFNKFLKALYWIHYRLYNCSIHWW
jgi:hypothetical protein